MQHIFKTEKPTAEAYLHISIYIYIHIYIYIYIHIYIYKLESHLTFDVFVKNVFLKYIIKIRNKNLLMTFLGLFETLF